MQVRDKFHHNSPSCNIQRMATLGYHIVKNTWYQEQLTSIIKFNTSLCYVIYNWNALINL